MKRNSPSSHGQSKSWLLYAFCLFCLLCLVSCEIPPPSRTTTYAENILKKVPKDVLNQKGIEWTVEQEWGTWPNTNWTAVEQDATDIENAGITWARTELYQDHPFEYFDKVLQIAKRHHIHLLPIVYKSDPPKGMGTATQIAQYKQWLTTTILRYKNDIQYWEINNEPDIPENWDIDVHTYSDQTAYEASVQSFIRFMKLNYETIHANSQDAQVLYGGLSEFYAERYIDAMIKYDAYRYMDIMAFHPYHGDPQGILDRLNMLYQKMATQPGFAAKPVWVTEIGFHTKVEWASTNPGYVTTEQEKADDLVQTVKLLHSNSVPIVFWYILHEDDNYNGYGLTVRNPTTLQTQYLPAYNAYKNLKLT
jgi:hypothetical protein